MRPNHDDLEGIFDEKILGFFDHPEDRGLDKIDPFLPGEFNHQCRGPDFLRTKPIRRKNDQISTACKTHHRSFLCWYLSLRPVCQALYSKQTSESTIGKIEGENTA